MFIIGLRCGWIREISRLVAEGEEWAGGWMPWGGTGEDAGAAIWVMGVVWTGGGSFS